MAKINFPVGQSPTVGLTLRDRQTTRLFPNVGLGATPAANFTANATRMNKIIDGDVLEALSVRSVSRGRANVRDDPDDGLVIELALMKDDRTEDILITYDKTVGGVPSTVTDAVITVNPTDRITGFADGLYYLPETDSNNQCIIEPGEASRKIYCSTTGLTAADIVAREPTLTDPSEVTGAWLANNFANGETSYYGETEALALDELNATNLWDELVEDKWADGVWLLFKVGDDFQNFGGKTNRVRANSWLHPHLFTSWAPGTIGDGFFTGRVATGSGSTPANGIVYQNYTAQEGVGNGRTLRSLYDGINSPSVNLDPSNADNLTSKSLTTDTNQMNQHVTVRRYKCVDSYLPNPFDPTALDWGQGGRSNRTAALYINAMYHSLVEYMFCDMTGVDVGGNPYRVDGNLAHGHPPSVYSHGIYQQGGVYDCTTRDFMSTRSTYSPMQNRSSGNVERFFGVASNGGLSVGPTNDLTYPSFGGNIGSRSYFDDVVITQGGFMQTVGAGNPVTNTVLNVTAGGIKSQAPGASYMSCIVANSGPDNGPIVNLTDLGPIGEAKGEFGFRPTSQGGYAFGVANFYTHSWVGENENTSGLDTAAMDGATVQLFNDQWKGVTGSTLQDFCNNMRAESEPWTIYPAFQEFMQTPFGEWQAPRTVATDVTWEPQIDGRTPGYNGSLKRDWSTGDLPGAVAGDNVVIPDNHFVRWNMTPKNALGTLTLGADVDLEISSGALRVTGTTVSGAGSIISVIQGAKFSIGGYTDTDVLAITVNDARFVSGGTVSGPIDMTLRSYAEAILCKDGASYDVTSGANLTVGGLSKAGFDGQSGTGNLTVNGTLAYTTSCILIMNNMISNTEAGGAAGQQQPKIGTVLTGLMSGATGIVSDVIVLDKLNSTARIVLDQCTGVFVDGEQLSGTSVVQQVVPIGTGVVIGNVNGTPVYSVGVVREFRSGDGGSWADPNITSNVVLANGSTVTVDTNGLLPGTYDLIDVDSLTDSGASLPTGVSVSGNKLVLTVA